MKPQTFEELQELLAITTGHSVEEIQPTSQLEVDLGVNMEDDFPRLLSIINQKFEVKLDIRHVLKELEVAGDTVEQLAKLIEEEVELG